jgi:hypothetical protein
VQAGQNEVDEVYMHDELDLRDEPGMSSVRDELNEPDMQHMQAEPDKLKMAGG